MGKVLKLFDNKNYHWYEVRYIYKDKKGHRQFDFVSQIGISNKKQILDRRKLKKITLPLHKEKNLKDMLNNGVFNVEVICYLGYFSK